jgi:hypothetical protein
MGCGWAGMKVQVPCYRACDDMRPMSVKDFLDRSAPLDGGSCDAGTP